VRIKFNHEFTRGFARQAHARGDPADVGVHGDFAPVMFRVGLGKISAQRERERVLGQGDRGGGGPAGRAAEGNAGPAPFLGSLVEPQAMSRELNQTHPNAPFEFIRSQLELS
jgi:hypothetical protein